jgi:hypothetical protein
MTTLRDGTVLQSALLRAPNDRAPFSEAFVPVLGMVVAAYPPDHPSNRSAAHTSDPARGACLEIDVEVFGADRAVCGGRISNVVVTPDALSELDEFDEDYPRVATKIVGSDRNIDDDAPAWRMDGQWVVVGFLGGSSRRPFVMRWFPNPLNFFDGATQGGTGFLPQAGRKRRRTRGIDWVITKEGSVLLDMQGAGTDVDPKTGERTTPLGATRKGDLFVYGRDGRIVGLDFNPRLPTPVSEPAFPQTNPPHDGEVAGDTAALAQREASEAAAATARQAADAARSTLLANAGPALVAAQAAKTAAETLKATIDGELATAQAAAEALATAISAAEAAMLAAEAAAIPPVPATVGAIAKLAAMAELAVKTAAMEAKRIAARAQARAVIEARRVEIEAAAAAAAAARATAAAAAPNAPENRGADRLLPDGTFVRGRTTASFGGDDVEVYAGSKVKLRGRAADGAVELGGTPETPPTQHATIAEPLEEAFNANADLLEELIDKVNKIAIQLGVDPVSGYTSRFPAEATARDVKVA